MPKRSVSAERFRPLIFQALVLPLAAMVVFAGVLLWQATRLIAAYRWVDHTDQVISQTNEARTKMVQSQADIRAFLITGDETYLKTLDDVQESQLPAALTALEKLVSDNPPQVRRFKDIEPLRQDWFSYINREIALRSSNGDWQALVKQGVAKKISDEIRHKFDDAIKIEEDLRAERIAVASDSFTETIWITLGVAFSLGIALALISRRQIRFLSSTYDSALAEADTANEVLEKRVEERTLELAVANSEMQRGAEILKITNDRLRVSNRELQDFASVASHDLQEPLRKVQAFGDRLKAKSSDKLGPDGLDNLERMLNAAGRMKVLINDLLSFARVTSRAQPFGPVDLHQVAEQVLSDLETRIEQKQATVDIGHLPVIDADVTQMRQVFQNLIGNALKFAKAETKPHVEVNATQHTLDDNPAIRLTVKDNGIGFDEKYLDRIFTVFQRLHGRTEYEGTGIGLAVVRKIIDRHRGTITARSKPGEGAEFIVELPLKQSPANLPGDPGSDLPEATRQEINEAISA